MTDRETARTIDDAAADWAAKLDRGLNDPEQDELEQWLSQDMRRVGALARARALWSHAEQGLMRESTSPAPPAVVPTAQLPGERSVTRRRLIAGGVAVAASIAFVPFLLNRPRILSSDMGEVRRIGLGDGSTVTLGADSRIRSAFTATERLIELLAGEAFFEVTQDAQRPFVVIVQGLRLRATAAAFGVRMLAGSPLSVVVSHGSLGISGDGIADALRTSLPPVLDANMRLDLDAEARLAKVATLEPDALQRSLAWRDGMLSFEGETLAVATRRFDRYAPVRFEITDPALARETITGLFAANDPKGFARAIAPSLNARAEIDGDTVRLLPAQAAQ